MINRQYKLTSPFSIEAFYQNIDWNSENVLIKPEKLSICKADIRYYFGMRDAKILKQRLPLALIHEACGSVLHDGAGRFETGQKVILLPNIPGHDERFGENYRPDSLFCSSRADGFMQELISLPHPQIVPYENMSQEMAAITELVSVGVHAVTAYLQERRRKAERIAVWGDGALGYVTACLLKYFIPGAHLTIVGANRTKLPMFQFADACMTVDEVSGGNQFDDVFECVGGAESGGAISQMIDTILPEGMMTLMGVSEEPVPINTRMVLEKGLGIHGRSRSARGDFEKAVEILENDRKFAGRIAMLVSDVVEIKGINDIHKAFEQSKIIDFKLIMDWKL